MSEAPSISNEQLAEMAQKLDQAAIEQALFKQLVRKKLSVFIKATWHVVRPGVKLSWNWHIDVVCYYLEHVTHPELHGQDERLKRLIINLPPGGMKSLIVDVFWPAWVWLTKPWWQWIFVTYQQQLTLRDATTTHQLMESDEYKQYVMPGKAWTFDKSQDTKAFYKNTETGYRISLSVDGGGTGYRANTIVFDDPTNIQKNPTIDQLMLTNDWWDTRMSNRLNDMVNDSIVGIMQRVHELDLTGWLLERDERERAAGNTEHIPYEVIKIPAEFKKDSPKPYDPRRDEGELFFPERFPKAVLDGERVVKGDFGYEAQYQQNPFPAGGGIFQVQKIKLWVHAGTGHKYPMYTVKDREGNNHPLEIIELPTPDELSGHAQSWDCAFKDLDSSDYVCGQIWAYANAKFWMLDLVLAKMGITATMNCIRQWTRDYPEAFAKWIEDKANGTAVVEMLKEEILGLDAVPPVGGKESRAQACVPFVDAGNVVLPHPAICPLVNVMIQQLAKFPKGANDDAVDAMTQALNKMGMFSGDYMEHMIKDFNPTGINMQLLRMGYTDFTR